MLTHAVKPKLASGKKTSVDAIRVIEVARLVADLHRESEAANDEHASAQSLYAYVLNNPLRYTDPTGEAAQAAVGCALGSWAGPIGCGAGAAIATGLTILGGAAILSGDTPKQCKDDKDDKCDKQYYEVDIPTCRGISRSRGAAAAARCYASAAERYAACLNGRPMPPLDTYNN